MASELDALAVLAGKRVAARHAQNVAHLTDPVAWVTDRLGEHLWSRQRDILTSVRDNRRTAVKSAHEVGKSYTASRAAAWWLDTHAPGEAFVVTTAPTYPQVRAILWREINRAHAKGRLAGRVNQTEWWIGNEIVAFGRKPSDYDPAAFQGIHARYVLVIIDEAAGVPESLWDAADSLIANDASRILAIGNPDDPASHFATICKPGSGWTVQTIRAADTPNFTGEWVPDELRPLLIGRVWVEEKRASWGEGSPLWQSKIEAEFPENSDDGVVPYTWAQSCRELDEPEGTPVELGVDVGGGGDQTVIYARRGRKARLQWRGSTPDPRTVSGQVIAAIRDTGATRVKVDVVGIGWGIVGMLDERRAEHGAEIVGVNVGEASSRPDQFAKLRDELWWDVGRENSRLRAWDLSECDDDTIAQLIAPRYGIDAAGRTKVEPKDDTRKRLGRSPDDADALLLAFYEPNHWGEHDMEHAFGVWRCVKCGHMFTWAANRPCPKCGTPAPESDEVRV